MVFLNRFFFYIILMAIGRRGVWEAGCQVLVKTASTEKQACEFSVKELKSNGLLSLMGSYSCFSVVRTIF